MRTSPILSTPRRISSDRLNRWSRPPGIPRRVEPEFLDHLPADHPDAIRSRGDLRRLNTWMRHPVIMARALREKTPRYSLESVVDLGAGDGSLLLSVARRLAPSTRGVRATLVDRQTVVDARTVAAFARLEWRVETTVADAFRWLKAERGKPPRTFVTNLFLHHLATQPLAELLESVAHQAARFIAIEPRRHPWPLLCSRLVGALGCNSITRHDAVTSVRAGFTGRELSALWPAHSSWRLTECRAGLFSHLFVAQRAL